jgi:hypothetical protein
MSLIIPAIKKVIDKIFLYILFNPHLLIILISIINFFFLGFFEITLCDDSFLDDLKFSLEKDIDKYSNALKNFDSYYDLFNQAKVRPEKNNGLEEYLLSKSLSYNEEAKNRLSKIRLTENLIKQFDSSFVSKVRKE